MERRKFIQTSALGTIAACTLGYSCINLDKSGKSKKYCYESEREIPVLADVDVLVIGGSSGAVAAAAAAAKKGCSVFLVGYLPYLGDDICGTYKFWLENGEKLNTELAKKIFKEKTPTPMEVKSILDNELIENNVDFLYSCYATNLIYDSNNTVAGAVVVSRSGRQAIKSKVVIDATHGAEIAKMAGANTKQYSLNKINFFYTVVGNNPIKSKEVVHIKKRPEPIITDEKSYDVLEYQFEFDFKDNTYASLMEIAQKIRDKTFDIEQSDCSDLIHYLPPYKIVCEKDFNKSTDNISKIPIEAFIPKKIENILILSGCADVNRETAKKLNNSVALMELGEIIGDYSVKLSTSINNSEVCGKSKIHENYMDNGEIKEYLKPLRGIWDKGYVKNSAATLPVLAEYDVVIAGGGTAGAPAGISAGIHGAKTLVLEYLYGLGGMGTMGHMEYYWDGNREGFTKQIIKGVNGMAPSDHPRQVEDKSGWVFDWKTEWYRKEILKYGGDIWFGVMCCGTWVENNKIKGVVVTSPFGRGVVLCKVVIDSSGSSDLAIASGAQYQSTDGKSFAVQGAGLAFRYPGHLKENTDWSFLDDSDILDVSRMYVQGKKKFNNKYDLCKIPQTRERRRIVGEYTITTYDIMNNRTYDDTISHHYASFDTHGYTLDPLFTLRPPGDRNSFHFADVPIRSLLPKGLKCIITTGLGASAERDAMPVLRMQACVQNQGYAVGYLAAIAVSENKEIRDVDIKKIQKHLVEIGSLPKSVLTDKNSEEFTEDQLREAANAVINNYDKLEVLLTNHKKANEIISERFINSNNHNDKLIYASILSVLDNSIGWKVIHDEIKKYSQWDEGWHYKGQGQYGRCLSKLDSHIMTLGYTKVEAGLPSIIKKAQVLKSGDYFSHFRAIAVALETIKSDKANDILSELLKMDNMQGYDVENYRDALEKMSIKNYENIIKDDDLRNRELKEIFLAGALYRCGDKNGLGEKILLNYARGFSAHYARHAWYILNE